MWNPIAKSFSFYCLPNLEPLSEQLEEIFCPIEPGLFGKTKTSIETEAEQLGSESNLRHVIKVGQTLLLGGRIKNNSQGSSSQAYQPPETRTPSIKKGACPCPPLFLYLYSFPLRCLAPHSSSVKRRRSEPFHFLWGNIQARLFQKDGACFIRVFSFSVASGGICLIFISDIFGSPCFSSISLVQKPWQ